MVNNDKRVRCPRCDGAMVFERFQDMLTLFYSWRCVNCGEIVDPVVSFPFHNGGGVGCPGILCSHSASGMPVDPGKSGSGAPPLWSPPPFSGSCSSF
jgi:hypothetical protein